MDAASGRRDVVDADAVDLNMVVAGLLSDLAWVQTSEASRWGYKQAASAIRDHEEPIESLVRADGTLARIPRIGPASTRVILEVVRTGDSPTVEAAVAASPRKDDVFRRRHLRRHFLSRARVRTILDDSALPGLQVSDYRGDLQMHSTWSDGGQTLAEIVETGLSRQYRFSAVTDHSSGLPIARGLSAERFAQQRREIEGLNARYQGRFRLLHGVEANIAADGTLDVELAERRRFDIVVAAPHSGLRSEQPQTERMLSAVQAPSVHILGHPRGRMYGSRPGVTAEWGEVFAAASRNGVAIEIDGDPSRQDLDFTLARAAAEAGCLLALDSDAHATNQWEYAEVACAHARLAGVPLDRIINTWTVDRLLHWAAQRSAVHDRRS